MPRLIDTSRALRKRLREHRSSPMLFTPPGLRASLELLDVFLQEVEDLDDRVALLELANGTYLIGERKNAAGS